MTRPPSPTVTKARAIAGLCLAILCAAVSLHAEPVPAQAAAPASADKAPSAAAR